ncbi:hypothetical protein HBI81_173450 [Parastagonospora nodorum]|nr:hypothetical protein HBI01_187040 [Parastagonospora nodorum]KAH4360056.1 hypothetical protein HBH94_196890 [Parastagonospora nodorum]KAH4454530.1 hypothetical protein HBH90_173040 [Parastagonospora nodorum]KAH4478841.1 hypothetical protein HBH88_197950 [Parastagonospora nodorum]KAH4501828.1 hypothetical protein HBH87_178730 [Parastagonospora nodorum]
MEGRPEELTDLWAWLLPSVEDMMTEEYDDKGSCRLSKSINDYDGKSGNTTTEEMKLKDEDGKDPGPATKFINSGAFAGIRPDPHPSEQKL